MYSVDGVSARRSRDGSLLLTPNTLLPTMVGDPLHWHAQFILP